jgi:serine/threonine-protein kinase
MAEHDEAEREELIAVVRAMAARLPVDWTEVESSASDESLRATVRELKIIAEITELHRNLPAFDSPSSPTSTHSPSNESSSADSRSLVKPGSPIGTWGPLTLLEQVGHGSFGEVYRALDGRLDREVALKLLRRRDASTDYLGSAVIEEGRLLARVRHPNVVTVHGADRIDGRVGVWMEFVRGRTLEQTLQQQGPLPSAEVAAMGVEICRALEAVHQAGLVHRDIKAHNVMQQEDGGLVLMDFGAGRALTDDGVATDLAGTPLYLAPEIFEGEPATEQSDIYSVGVLLYHLLTGAYPIAGRTVREIRDHHNKGHRVPLETVADGVPGDIARAISRAIETDPMARYPNASEFAAQLASYLSDSPRSRLSPQRLAVVALLGASIVAITAVSIAVLNVDRSRDRLLGRPGQPNAAGSPAASATTSQSLAVRRVLLPNEYLDLGKPSVDGRYFPFLNTQSEVVVKDLETGLVHQLTKGSDSEGYAEGAPRISSDNRWVVYPWRSPDQAFELRIMQVREDKYGPQARVLLRTNESEVYPVDWSRDGTEILSVVELKSGTTQIALVSVADGSMRPLKEFTSIRPLGVSLSPDGRFVVYDHPQVDDLRSRDIYVIATDGSGEWPIVEQPGSDMLPTWVPDGNRVLYTSDRTGALGVWIVAVEDGRAVGEPEVLSRDMGRMSPIGPTSTGAFFYRQETGLVDVHTVSLDPVSGMVTGKSEPVLPSRVGSNISSDWSADGNYLAYVKIKNPAGAAQADPYSRALSIHDVRSRQERDLWPALAFFIAPRWSPDGRSILVSGVDLKQRVGLHRVDVRTGRVEPAIIDNDRTRTSWPRWVSANVITFANFGSDDPSIVSRNLISGAQTRLATIRALGVDRLTPPMQGTPFGISPDGRQIAFSGWIGNGDTAYALLKLFADGVVTEIVRGADGPGRKGLFFQAWTPDGLDLLFTKDEPDRRTSLWRVSSRGGTPRPMGLEVAGLRDVHISSDATRLTFTTGSQIGDIRVMENFLPR